MSDLFADTTDRDKDQIREVLALPRRPRNDDDYDAFLDFQDWAGEIAKAHARREDGNDEV